MNEIFSIRNRTAIVTGGARGIGRMIAEGFTKAGAKVYITARDEKKCAEAANQMSGFGTCLPLPVDLSDPGNIKTMSEQFARQEDKLDILVNNAGKSWGAPLESFPDKAWNSVMSVNVQSPFTLVRDLLPLLKSGASADDPSRVINIGSVSGLVSADLEAYSDSASKAAIHHLTRVLAKDLAGDHINVNAVAPGFFPSDMTAHLRQDDAVLSKLLSGIPMGRLGKPTDISGLCVFLSSIAGAYMTGVVIPLDGGLVCNY